MHRQAETLMPQPPATPTYPNPLPGALSPPLTGQDGPLVKRGREVAVTEWVTEVRTGSSTKGKVDLKT